MGLSKEDHVLIKNLYGLKGYGAKRLMEFLAKEWKKTTLNDFSRHLRQNHDCSMRQSMNGEDISGPVSE